MLLADQQFSGSRLILLFVNALMPGQQTACKPQCGPIEIDLC